WPPMRTDDASLLGNDHPAKKPELGIDAWVVAPDTAPRRKRGRGLGRRTGVMAQSLIELVEQFITYQAKQRGKAKGGIQTYRWNLNHFMRFVHEREGRPACLEHITESMIQAWMDKMAGDNLALSTLRTRQSTMSSFATWLVK